MMICLVLYAVIYGLAEVILYNEGRKNNVLYLDILHMAKKYGLHKIVLYFFR